MFCGLIFGLANSMKTMGMDWYIYITITVLCLLPSSLNTKGELLYTSAYSHHLREFKW